VDEEGRQLPPGEKGEMLIHNPWMFSGYYKDAARTEAAFVNDPLKKGYNELYFRTGDMGYMNEKGELVVAGRKDNMIKHNGYRMELGEVEFAALGAEGVNDCCCVFDKEKSDIYLCYTGSLAEKEVKAYLKDRVPRFALPEYYVRLESLPYTANMKVNRLELARPVIGGK
jgi:acyl-coenzyme A synthetase/AMP-(fatty) acid ligase